MNPFALDPTEQDNQLTTATLNPGDPSQTVGFFAGSATGIFKGLESSFYRDKFYTADVYNEQPTRTRALDNLRSVQPDPASVGTAGQFLFGLGDSLGSLGLSFLGGNVTPNLMAIQTAKTYAASQTPLNIDKGMDPKTAADVASTEGIGVGLGGVVPIGMAGKLLTRIASGAGVNVVMGGAQRAIVQQTLSSAGYEEMAKQYDPFQVSNILTDATIGGFFGGVFGHKGGDVRTSIKPSDVDTILTMNNAGHSELDTAPGIPADPAARAAHVEALNTAIEQLMSGEAVNVGDTITNENFIDNPGHDVTGKLTGDAVAAHLSDVDPEILGLQKELTDRGIDPNLDLYSAINRVTPDEAAAAVRSEPTKYTDNPEANRAILAMKRGAESGDLNKPAADLGIWVLQQNPKLGSDLTVRIGDPANPDAGGSYKPIAKIATLAKDTGEFVPDPHVAAHEIMHHAERMLPDDLRAMIKADFKARLADLLNDPEKAPLVGTLTNAADGDREALLSIMRGISDGQLPPDIYQFTSSSEYWAANAARILADRANPALTARLKQYFKELIEKIKDAFGYKSDTPIIKALDAAMKADGTMTGEMLYSGGLFNSARRAGEVNTEDRPASASKAVDVILKNTAENENRPAIVVGGRPGNFGWSFENADGGSPPIQHPVQRGPRLEKIAPAVHKILSTKGFKDLAADVANIEGLKVDQIEGTWLGNPEPSFVVSGKGLDEQSGSTLAKMLGFGFAQDSTILTKHSPDLKEGIPTVYIGGGKLLTGDQVAQIMQLAKEKGLDLSTSADKKAVKFMHFDGEETLPAFMKAVREIADESGMEAGNTVMTQGELYEAHQYLEGKDSSSGEPVRLFGSGEEPSSLFGRVVDHVLIPYAQAVAAEGYRLSPDRLAERFGLSDAERELIREKLRPKANADRSTVPLMTGEETLDIQPTGKNGRASVTDIMWALQNRAARLGQIEPGDYSDNAKKLLAKEIAKEVAYHVQHSVKSAIGWYDAALQKAKEAYYKFLPELKSDPDKAMMFDAVLGITSQGNDVHSNSSFAVRVYQLVRDGSHTLSEATDILKGTFGSQTRAIEQNLVKLQHLIDVNGYARMRELFNKKMTVGEWNALLRADKTLFGPDGKKLSVSGAASQMVNGWMVFGPKIGSFINNLHGDYSTLTADLWFSRTWNRLLGFMFQHAPEREAKQYQEFKDALFAESSLSTEAKTQNGKAVMKDGKPVPWEHGNDVVGMGKADLDALVNDPNMMLELATRLYESYSKGGYKDKSDLRRRAKNWIESREDPLEAPRGDLERSFQQDTVEQAQKLLKKQTGMDITVADIQAALWFHEKELFSKLGVTNERSEPADYADAAKATLDAYGQGTLYYVPSKGEYIGGKGGEYLGITIPTENGVIAADKAIAQADAEITTAKTESQAYDVAAACALRG